MNTNTNNIPKINYCIATYEGKCLSRKNPEEANNLHDHIVILSKLIPTLKIPITQITIVKPICKDHIKHENYYRFNKWSKMFPTVPVFILEFNYPKLYSYGQWIYNYKCFPNFDYYIVIEDDYVFYTENFTEKLLKLYREKIPNNFGYLSSWVSKLHKFSLHSAISNGMISREAFSTLDINLFSKNVIDSNCQYMFSKMLIDRGVILKDFIENYKAYFWNGINVINYSKNSVKETLIVPVQFLRGYTVVDTYSAIGINLQLITSYGKPIMNIKLLI